MNRFIQQEKPFSEETVSALSAALSLHPVTARALCCRGVTDVDAARAYLEPAFSDLHDPMLLPDIKTAVERIRRAIAGHERICIYGDYDADGVCATAILYKQLRRMGAQVECFVPSRHEDGYGMHEHTVELLCENGVDLIITVDNGITALTETALCADYCVDVIVTDHHIPREILPDCAAVVAASRRDSIYPYGQLCGAGVAYKLASALADGAPDAELLGLAAVATMADVVPLDGENRTLVQLGLPFVQKNRGLSALLRCAGSEEAPDAQALAFLIAPRLNAAGRMGDASRAIALLTSEDEAVIQTLSLALQNDNTRRREDETLVVNEIFDRFSDEELRARKAIVLFGAGWNVGVLGIVASRLCERYYRPVILFTEHQESWVGSGRSTASIHLHDSLLPFRERFLRFGGHARAVGITIAPEAFEAFAADYNAHLTECIDPACFVPTFPYEQELSLADVDAALVEEFGRLAPFGEGNPNPVFRLAGISVSRVRTLGKSGEHVDATVRQGDASLRLIGFHKRALLETLRESEQPELLCTLQNNTFRGQTNPELLLVACNAAQSDSGSGETEKIIDAIREELLYNTHGNCDKLCDLFSQVKNLGVFAGLEFELEDMRARYRMLRQMAQAHENVLDPAALTDDMLFALCVFSELGFFTAESGVVRMAATCRNRELAESALYANFCGATKE